MIERGETIALTALIIGVVAFSVLMFYIAKSLERMLASDTKKEAQS